jgi:hypothetical protein
MLSLALEPSRLAKRDAAYHDLLTTGFALAVYEVSRPKTRGDVVTLDCTLKICRCTTYDTDVLDFLTPGTYGRSDPLIKFRVVQQTGNA